MDLSGKRVLVTGVSSGLGVETTRALAARGAHVVGAARDLAKAEPATVGVRVAAAAAGGLLLTPLPVTCTLRIKLSNPCLGGNQILDDIRE